MRSEQDLRQTTNNLRKAYEERDRAIRKFLLSNKDEEADKVFTRLASIVGVVPTAHWYAKIHDIKLKKALLELRNLVEKNKEKTR